MFSEMGTCYLRLLISQFTDISNLEKKMTEISRVNCKLYFQFSSAFLSLYTCVDSNMRTDEHYCERDILSRALVNFIPGFDLDYCLG